VDETREDLFEFTVKVFVEREHMDQRFLARAEFPDGRIANTSSMYFDHNFSYKDQARELLEGVLYHLVRHIAEEHSEQSKQE
jgi:hypothetical protein